jgi:hypothetical protein
MSFWVWKEGFEEGNEMVEKGDVWICGCVWLYMYVEVCAFVSVFCCLYV